MAKLTPYETSLLLPRIAHCHTYSQVDAHCHKMKIEARRPPNFDYIQAHFPNAENFGVIFAFGNTIYNPSGIKLPPSLVAHEATHSLQQEEIGGPEIWWGFYIEQSDWMIGQELDAYRIEYREHCNPINKANRHSRHRMLCNCAERLASPLYNRGIKKKLAQKLIQLEAPNG
jgi:hypothetical protein